MARYIVVLLVLWLGACGRNSEIYGSFVASHDAIRPGMSLKQVFESGLADYLVRSDGKNIAGATVPERIPVGPDCRRHVVDIHSGRGTFTVRIYCNMNGPSDRQLATPGLFSSKHDFLEGVDRYRSWMRSLRFRVESPALRVGGVYDSYEFVIDESGKVAAVSTIKPGT
jgi:hypothetical protein